MTTTQKLRVSWEAVEAARAEVAAYEIAGIADQLDPLVRVIARATPAPHGTGESGAASASGEVATQETGTEHHVNP